MDGTVTESELSWRADGNTFWHADKHIAASAKCLPLSASMFRAFPSTVLAYTFAKVHLLFRNIFKAGIWNQQKIQRF